LSHNLISESSRVPNVISRNSPIIHSARKLLVSLEMMNCAGQVGQLSQTVSRLRAFWTIVIADCCEVGKQDDYTINVAEAVIRSSSSVSPAIGLPPYLPLRLAAISSSMNPNPADQMELMRLKMSQEKLHSEAPLGTGATAWMGEEAIGHAGPFEPQGSGK
jgi:hypothetical protein